MQYMYFNAVLIPVVPIVCFIYERKARAIHLWKKSAYPDVSYLP
jgi:hypothetical protein